MQITTCREENKQLEIHTEIFFNENIDEQTRRIQKEIHKLF